MRFRILSHAGLLVEQGGKSLVCDPWLVGSCYWRSWWNYPPVDPAIVDGLRPDFIYLTHIHWDHFHGATLKHFDRATPVLVPRDHHSRMREDLAWLGFENVTELDHGRPFRIGDDFVLTSYQIMPYLDSLLVVEAGGVTLANANDAKFMGPPLRQILKRHPRIDFVLRSHSSANNRNSFHFVDGSAERLDDEQRYIRSFAHFAAAMKARHAIPFASNHCHLHDDVFALNKHIQTPALVERYCAERYAQNGVATKVQIMLSGDEWSSEEGFRIAPNTWFEDRDAHLQAYRERVQGTLRRNDAEEAAQDVTAEEMQAYFNAFQDRLPWPIRRRIRRRPLVIAATRGAETRHFSVDFAARTVTAVPDEGDGTMTMIIPVAILKQAMELSMFAHAAISKRVRYRVTRETFATMVMITNFLGLDEHRVLPVSRVLRPAFLRVYARRWRELLLVAQLVTMTILNRRPENLELALLSRDSGVPLERM